MALSQREKILLGIPVALAVILGGYNFVHEPLFTRRAEAAERQSMVTQALQKDQQRLAKEGNLKVRKEAVVAREQVLDTWVPGKNSAALFIWYLSQAESQAGVRVKGLTVGEKKQVTVNGNQQQTKTGAPAPAAPASGNATQSTGSTVKPVSNGSPDAGATSTLMVIRLDMKVEGRFAEHLLFNQALEKMKLFLNTDALGLVKAEQASPDQVGKLLEQGNSLLATEVLKASPNLDGVYQINLYFKGGKVGPTTEPMQFGEDAGRMDPFVMDAVEDFIRILSEYYNTQSLPGGTGPKSPTAPAQPGKAGTQMG